MIRHQFRYEWMGIRREKMFMVLSVLWLLIAVFAVRNGQEKVDVRLRDIAKAREELAAFDRKSASAIDSLHAGLMKAPESWLDPRSLSFYGQRGARVVAMEPAPLASLATGQSDLYTHIVRPRLSAEAHTLAFSELSNPVQLMFGSFDLSFVVVYLLPLLVLSFSYNLLSEEKEQGIFRLTGSQPISIYQWLLVRVLFRFLLLSAVVVVSVLVALLVNGIGVLESLSAVSQLLLIVIAYIFFWFVVSVIVNLKGTSSGYNASVLVGIWVVVVLMIPAVVSQFVNTVYPVPSRINMIHEFRVAEAESSRKTDQILRGYLNEHPELAPKDSAISNQYSWWLGHFASADVVREAVEPLLLSYNQAIEQQQAWVGRLRFLSPAVLTQDAINDLAGTSTAHYNDFRKQVFTFSTNWREYFLPRMFANQSLSRGQLAELPAYSYSDAKVPSVWWADFFGVMAFGMLFFGLSLFLYRRSAMEQLMIS